MKNYFTLLSIVFIIFTIFSCTKEELPQEEEFIYSDELLGTWRMISNTRFDCDDPANSGLLNIDYDCSNPDAEFCIELIYDFKSDNRLDVTQAFVWDGESSFTEVSISYRFDGSNFYSCNDNGENCELVDIVTTDGNNITMFPTNITIKGCALRSKIIKINCAKFQGKTV